MNSYDVLIVGAGLFGSVLAERLSNRGKKVLVVEKEEKPGGTVATAVTHNITVHLHGAHIFRTNSTFVWEYINRFGQFKKFVNTPIAIHNNEAYNMPFNMNTFSKFWHITTPDEAKAIIHKQVAEYGLNQQPRNLEEYAISIVGIDIYDAFIRDYTEKQWNKPCNALPASIMRRIPIRYTYDNNYYTDVYQGIPERGYSHVVENLLDRSCITLLCGVDGKSFIQSNPGIATQIVYTGCIDNYFDYSFGDLEYRSLRFETSVYATDNYQGVAVVNYSDKDVLYTRSIEHKHFLNEHSDVTVITREYPESYIKGSNIPYYPIEDDVNLLRYNQYLDLVPRNMIFAGRLGSYKYTSMDETVINAISLADTIA